LGLRKLVGDTWVFSPRVRLSVDSNYARGTVPSRAVALPIAGPLTADPRGGGVMGRLMRGVPVGLLGPGIVLRSSYCATARPGTFQTFTWSPPHVTSRWPSGENVGHRTLSPCPPRMAKGSPV